jgi:Ca2+-binding EF-hand superfamily protein
MRFKEEYDKNKDGVLEGEEIRAWLVPDLRQTAKQEADHLIEAADTDKVSIFQWDKLKYFVFRIGW